MKKFYLIVLLVAISLSNLYSQVPDAFNYQAVVRDATGNILANQDVSFRISILKNSESGTVVYSETHAATTNAFGLANLVIGEGTQVSGTFSPDGWSTAPHFVKIEIDPNGGSAFSTLGTSKLLSVPYAFAAENVVNDKVNDADADSTNEIQTISISGTVLTLSDGGGSVTLPSAGGGGDNWGTQTVKTDATLTGEGTTANPLSVVGDLTDDQTLSISGNELSISDGNTVTLPAGTGYTAGTGISITGSTITNTGDTDASDDVTEINNLSDAIYNGNSLFLGEGAGSTDNGDANYNVAVGKDALKLNESGTTNTAVGYHALSKTTKSDNTAVGYEALGNNTIGEDNTAMGRFSLYHNESGHRNVALGAQSLFYNVNGNYNTAVGFAAGNNSTGSYNVFLGNNAGADETGSNKLYIENSNSSTPLIGGDFATDEVTINGSLAIKDGTQGDGKVLTSDANGVASWQTPASGGSSLWSEDTNGLYYSSGHIGIGRIPSETNLLEVHSFSGETAISAVTESATKAAIYANNALGLSADFRSPIKISDGTQGDGKVLTSDSNGVASWEDLPAGGSSLWTSGAITYHNGMVGINSSTDEGFALTVNKGGAMANLLLNSDNDALMRMTRKTTSDQNFILFSTEPSDQSYKIGLQSGNENFRLFPTIHASNGMEMDATGNVLLHNDLSIAGTIKIEGGTPAVGKVLTSDANGLASWQTPSSSSLWTENASDIYFNTGNVGLGISSPGYSLDIQKASATLNLKAITDNAVLYLDRKASNKYAYLLHRTNGANNYYVGLLGDDDYWINYGPKSTFKGLKVQTTGNVATSNDVSVGNNLDVNGDAFFNQNIEVSDDLTAGSITVSSGEVTKTTTGANNNLLPFAYGYVTSSGSLSSGTSNVGTINHAGTGEYEIPITSLGSGYIAMVTPNESRGYLTAVVTSRTTTAIVVTIWDTKNSTVFDGGFSFVIYKP